MSNERAAASESRERSGASGVPARERVGGAAGAEPPGQMMDPDQAQLIVAAYASVLERHDAEDVYPAPAASLPYPKETIKIAIRTSAATLSSMGHLTSDLNDSLEMAYLSLADYVDDEVARLMREHRKASRDLAIDGLMARDKKELPAWRVISETSAT